MLAIIAVPLMRHGCTKSLYNELPTHQWQQQTGWVSSTCAALTSTKLSPSPWGKCQLHPLAPKHTHIYICSVHAVFCESSAHGLLKSAHTKC